MTKRTPKKQGRRRILVVDDHPMTRHGISQLLELEPDLVVSDAVGTAKAGLAAFQAHPPDLVLADLSLTERSGLELIKDMHALHPEIPVLVFSMHNESFYAGRVLRAGGRGYLMKSEGGGKLVEAIRRVLGGQIHLSEAMRDIVVKRFAHGSTSTGEDAVGSLSDRELEVFRLIGQGLGTAAIAGQLRLSTSTVETHRAHIKEKLNLKTAPELTRSAVEWLSRRDG